MLDIYSFFHSIQIDEIKVKTELGICYHIHLRPVQQNINATTDRNSLYHRYEFSFLHDSTVFYKFTRKKLMTFFMHHVSIEFRICIFLVCVYVIAFLWMGDPFYFFSSSQLFVCLPATFDVTNTISIVYYKQAWTLPWFVNKWF